MAPTLVDDAVAAVADGIGMRAFVLMRATCRNWRRVCASRFVTQRALALPASHPALAATRWLWRCSTSRENAHETELSGSHMGDTNTKDTKDTKDTKNGIKNDGALMLRDAAQRKHSDGSGSSVRRDDVAELARVLRIMREARGSLRAWERTHLLSWAHLLATRLRRAGRASEATLRLEEEEREAIEANGSSSLPAPWLALLRRTLRQWSPR